jgi:S-methylmethionine-dependent homocysteine/selenocysteine methylase
MSKINFIDRLQTGDVIVMDGATGSELQRRGVNINKGSIEGKLGVWSAAANLDAPDVVQAIHEDYLNAGAEIIISNNFYTSRRMMEVIGRQDQWEDYTRRGGELACQARDAINPNAFVAGGIAPPEHKCDLHEQFSEQSRVLAAAGVDFMLAEYMAGDSVMVDPISDCVTAVDACAESGLPVVLGICRVSEQGTMEDGSSFDTLVSALKGHPVAAICLMCSYPQDITGSLPKLRDAYSGPIGAYAHLEYDENPKFGSSPDEPFFTLGQGDYTPERYADVAAGWMEMGAQIIGGCCATTPDHIRAVQAAVKP